MVEASFAGVGRHVLDLARAQSAEGHEVCVVYSPTRESSSFESERRRLDEAQWHPCAMARSPHPSDVAAVRLVRRVATGADIIHGHSTKGGLIARLAALGHRGRVVYTPNAVYSMNPLMPRPARRLVGLIERALSTWTDAIIAVSPEEAAHLRGLGIAADKIRVVLNGTNPVQAADASEVRRTLGLPESSAIVGFLGRLDAQKAPDDLLDIFELALQLEPDLHLAVVGDGPLRSRLEGCLAASTTLTEKVSILGEHPGTWAMAAFDVLALPSRYEGFPYVLVEAAAQGLAFVSSGQSNATELLRRGATGDIVDRDDPAEFARLLAHRAIERRRHPPVVIGADAMADEVLSAYRSVSVATGAP